MTYQSFYNQWHHLACFSTAQVRAIYPTFNRRNYSEWQKAGYIVPLRQGWYAFADYVNKPDYARYLASKIYSPSYISLHTALSFYGIIPEAVVAITSITTRKEYEPVQTNVSSGMCDPYFAEEFWFGRWNSLDTFLRSILHVTFIHSFIRSLINLWLIRV